MSAATPPNASPWSTTCAAGLGVNYQRSGGVTLAPIRTGVGLRAGVNAQYQVYTDKRDWFPL